MRKLLLTGVIALSVALAAFPSYAQSTAPADEFEAALLAARDSHLMGKLIESADQLKRAHLFLQKQMMANFDAAFVPTVGDWSREVIAPNVKSRVSSQSDIGATLKNVYARENQKVEIKMLIESPIVSLITPLVDLAHNDPNKATNVFTAGPYKGLIKEDDGVYKAFVVINERIIMLAESQKDSKVTGDDLKALLQGLNYTAIR